MGLIDFVKNAGSSIFGKDEPEPQTAPAEPAGPSAEEIQRLHNRRKGARLVQLIEGLGFEVEGLTVKAEGDTVTLSGKVGSQADRERIVLSDRQALDFDEPLEHGVHQSHALLWGDGGSLRP